MASASGDPFAPYFEGGAVTSAPVDSYILVLGSRQGGKSSLVQRILRTDEELDCKPTVALDYTSVRASAVSVYGGRHEVAHIYELGSSSSDLSELMQVPITQQRLPTCSVVLVIDLSKPADMCATAVRWLAALHRRVSECLDKLKARKGSVEAATAPEVLLQGLDARLRLGFAQRSGVAVQLSSTVPRDAAEVGLPQGEGEGSPINGLQVHAVWQPAVSAALRSLLPEYHDWKLVNNAGIGFGKGGSSPMPVQILVVGSKWDTASNLDGPCRRAILATLRYIALCVGGSAVTASCLGRGAVSTLPTFRQMLLAIAFGLPQRRGCTAPPEGDAQLSIPAGADTLESILSSVGSSSLIRLADVDATAGGVNATFQTRLAPFAELLTKYFPQSASTFPEAAPADNVSVLGADGRWTFTDEAARCAPEPLIDAIRAAKADDLVRLQTAAKEKDKRIALEAKLTQTQAM